MQIKRIFYHSRFGDIGEVILDAPDELKMSLDGKELPAASVRYLLTFALQSLQDAYAGAKDGAEAKANFGKRYDRLVAGEIGTRSQRDTDEPELMRFLSEYRSNVKAAAKVDAQAYKDAEPKERDEMLMTWIMKQPEEKVAAWKEKGAELIAADKARKEEAAALGL